MITKTENPFVIEKCRVSVRDDAFAVAVNAETARCTRLVTGVTSISELEALLPAAIERSVRQTRSRARRSHIIVGGGMGVLLAVADHKRILPWMRPQSSPGSPNLVPLAMLGYAAVQITRGLFEPRVRIPANTVPTFVRGDATPADHDIFWIMIDALKSIDRGPHSH